MSGVRLPLACIDADGKRTDAEFWERVLSAEVEMDASDLGWRPGQWPERAIVNGCTFELVTMEFVNEDVMAANYRDVAAPNRKLVVFND